MIAAENAISKSFSADEFRKDAHQLVDIIAKRLKKSQSKDPSKTIDWKSPEEQLQFWQDDFTSSETISLTDFWENVFSHSINFHNKGYMGHQVAMPLPLTTLTSAVIGYMNNCTTVYELGMAGNAMEKVVIGHLADKFGYDKHSTGIVTSGGSLGNLTALVTARTSSGIDEMDHHKLAIMVSSEAHYSVERAAKIMGIKSANIIKVPVDDNFSIRSELLESTYQQAIADGKIVFCVVGCACTTSVGAYDNLTAIADFTQKHHLWFHVDGAHGGAVIFSDKYKYLLKGVEKSDSLILDFHKMMLVPSLSTAVIYNSKNRKVNEFSPQAAYLWQNQQSEEWYNSAKHTLECTKPITILHTYAIMRLYGDEIYRQHIDALYDLGKQFAKMVAAQKNMELATSPSSNVVCFRYLPNGRKLDEVNKRVLDELLMDGTFYIVGTTIKDEFYLRVSLMNPLTDVQSLENLIVKIRKIAKEL